MDSPPQPTPEPRQSIRLPGTTASHYARDPSPRVGGAALLALIALDTLGMLSELYRFLSTGHFEALLGLVTREVLMVALYFSFWAGQSWGRWVIAVTTFIYGLWLVIWSSHLVSVNGHLGAGFFLVFGSLNMATGFYFALAPDFTAFIKWRREMRNTAALLPITLMLGGYLALVAAAWIAVGFWRGRVEKEASLFAAQTIMDLGARWDAAELQRRCSAELIAMDPAQFNPERWENIRRAIGAVHGLQPAPVFGRVTINGGASDRFNSQCEYEYRGLGDNRGFRMSLGFHGDLAGDHWEIDAYAVVPD